MGFTSTSQTKILIVEDDPYMQIILKEFLSLTYEIEICSSGMEAISFLQNGNIPDLILSDYNIPQLTGLELIDQVKSSDFFSSIPIIILSGEESSEKRIKCLDMGADDFIVKPFNPAELAARIRVVLRRIARFI
ncbi:MAG: response regulator [Sphingobacteriaceae bacterium]|nr:MAG: response regulator [Sphingobacteriaceae bacterium]